MSKQMPSGAPMTASAVKGMGDELWKSKMEKMNSELLAFTYGSFVAQLASDTDDCTKINQQLDKIGYNIGIRLMDEFLARTNVDRCAEFRETADLIAKVGFKLFLGISPQVTNWSSDGKEFSLIFEENPLAEFVELPENCSELYYSNVYCGIIRGALEMVHMQAECTFVRCVLRGDSATEMRVRLLRVLEEQVPTGDD